MSAGELPAHEDHEAPPSEVFGSLWRSVDARQEQAPKLRLQLPDGRLRVPGDGQQRRVRFLDGSGDSDADEEADAQASTLAWLPLLFFLMGALVLTCTTIWYGPHKMLQTFVHYAIPQSPHWYHAAAQWGVIVVCATTVIPILFMLLPLPSMMFGFVPGFWITFFALMTAATLSFLIGRNVAQRPIRAFLVSHGYSQVISALRILEDESESFLLLVLYRFLLMPMFLRNYAVTILKVPLRRLILAAVPHSLWSSCIFAAVGSALKGPAELVRDGHDLEWRRPKWYEVLGIIAACGSALVFSFTASKAYARKVIKDKGKDKAALSSICSIRTAGSTPPYQSCGDSHALEGSTSSVNI